MMSGLVGGVETSLSKMFEAVGARKAGIIDDEGLLEYEQNVAQAAAHVRHVYRQQHERLCEAIGIALPGNGTVPAVSSRRNNAGKTRRHGNNGFGRKRR